MTSHPTEGLKADSDTKQVISPSTETQTMIVETTPAASTNSATSTPSADVNPAAGTTAELADAKQHLIGLSAPLEKNLVQIFKLLSDETRLRILMFLAKENELHVSALCERLGQSQPAVSHHLALLRVAGLAEARREGKHNFYSICRPHFQRVLGELFLEIANPATKSFNFEEFCFTQQS